ncbi:MAG: hypothetical protein A4E53_01338 [Pelotomaculum sp. PtaB.Bin104]|nr:MAG: hypothetical protein A4E53_01338 [Pelotomaculum sp. PtaB.Bin104]
MDEKLVSIEIQKELDILNKNWQEQVFLKLHIAARTTGFLADISDRDWKTLCVLATFMDTQGNCYPSQDEIAANLNICRQAANERIKSLLNYRWQGKPVVTMVKYRKDVLSGKKGQRWDNNRYTILPLSNISFGKDEQLGIENENHDIGNTVEKTAEKPISSDHDIGKTLDFVEEKPMSPYPDTGKDDTNKIFKRSVVVVDLHPGGEEILNDEGNSSTVHEDGAAFALTPANKLELYNQCGQTDQEDETEERPEWEKIREAVRVVAKADISVGFAKEIIEKYSPAALAAALQEMKRQLKTGMRFKKGVGSWLRSALENSYETDQKPEAYPEIKKETNTNRTPRARPKIRSEGNYLLTTEQRKKKKEIIRSLYT